MQAYSCTVETLEAVLSLCTLDEFNKLSNAVMQELPLYAWDERKRVCQIFISRLRQLISAWHELEHEAIPDVFKFTRIASYISEASATAAC